MDTIKKPVKIVPELNGSLRSFTKKTSRYPNSFNVDGSDVKDCNSGATSGGLKTYDASLSGDTLTVTTS